MFGLTSLIVLFFYFLIVFIMYEENWFITLEANLNVIIIFETI